MPPADYLKSNFGSRRRGANKFCLLFPWSRGLLHANMFFHQTFDVWQPLKFTLWVYYFLVPRPHYSTPRIRHQSELAEKAWENAIQELGKICRSPSSSTYYSRIVEILWLSWNWYHIRMSCVLIAVWSAVEWEIRQVWNYTTSFSPTNKVYNSFEVWPETDMTQNHN